MNLVDIFARLWFALGLFIVFAGFLLIVCGSFVLLYFHRPKDPRQHDVRKPKHPRQHPKRTCGFSDIAEPLSCFLIASISVPRKMLSSSTAALSVS